MITEYQRELHRRAYEKAKPAYAALMKFYPLTTDDLDGEIWRPIAGYDAYHVSNFGRVKSFYNCKIIIRKPVLSMTGYLNVNLSKDGKKKWFSVHRLVAQSFIPNPDNKPEVNHIDGHPMNCYVGNLEWSTSKENQQHALANGLRAQGEEQVQAKLTNEQVGYIRNNPDRLNLEQLAEKFGVRPATISRIQLGQKYKNAGGSIRPKRGVPEDIRAKIRAEYKKGVRGCGCYALAKKYGVDHSTILRIVNP